MRSIFTPVILLALVALAFGETDRQVCQRKNRWIVGAIDTFCSRTNMVVPSDYTNRGLLWKGNVQVSINGGCRPPQWVPSAICKRQFMNMCNSIQLASGKGQKSRTYGNNGCQQWQIIANNKPGQPAKAPKKGLGGNAAKNKAGKILAGLMKGGLKGLPKRDVDEDDDAEEFEGAEA